MADLQLGRADYHRSVAHEARIQTRNRYYELNPVLNPQQVALIARPALKRYLYVGTGPIRQLYSQPGDFSEALFVISGRGWWRVDLDGTTTLVQDGIRADGIPSMAATGPIGDTPPYMFMADGNNLYCYIEDGYALGTTNGSPQNGYQIRIRNPAVVPVTDVYYQFTTGSVDAGTPAGTAAAPYLIAVGSSDLISWQNFANALTLKGVAGTDYSTNTVANSDVQTVSYTALGVIVRANAIGALGNSVQTTIPTGSITWSAATLTGGGQPTVFKVPLPKDVGAVSVAYIAGYIVVIPTQSGTINGRFYWINPGETTIDELDFATAERAPDPVYNVVVFGDQFWLPGSNTTEVWYFTGNINAPVQRLQGVTFDRGTWQGTALQVKESMIIVDSDGGVFQIGGQLSRISNPSIEERIRQAILYQASVTFD